MSQQVSSIVVAKQSKSEIAQNLSLDQLVSQIPSVFSNLGVYLGKALSLTAKGISVGKPGAQEIHPPGAFVYLGVGNGASSNLVLMPPWFPELTRTPETLRYLDTKLFSLINSLCSGAISEQAFLVTFRRLLAQAELSQLNAIVELSRSMAAEETRMALSLDMLKAEKLLGEISDENYGLRSAVINEIRSFLIRMLQEITRVRKQGSELIQKISSVSDKLHLSQSTAQEITGLITPLLPTEQS